MHAGQTLSTDWLVEELWPDGSPKSARNRIHVYVMRLRKCLGDDDGAVLRSYAPGYVMDLVDGDLDADVFESLAGQGESAARAEEWPRASSLLAEALALWSGPVLAGVEVPGSLESQVVRLQERRIAVTEARIEADLRSDQGAGLVGELKELVAQHPYRERFCAQLLLALYRSGRQSDALEEYQRIYRRFGDELGVQPGRDLQDLHQQILQSDPGLVPVSRTSAQAAIPTAVPAAEAQKGQMGQQGQEGPESATSGRDDRLPVPRQLPPSVAGFTGRVEELAALDKTSAPIVVVAGAGGVGKTSLCVRWAHRAVERFPDGQLYVNLRGYAPGEPMSSRTALDGFCRALGARNIPEDQDERTALYRSLLADRGFLIVLDNARSSEQIRPLLPGSSGSRVLITSRDDLAGLVARDGAERFVLSRMDESAALDLLSEIVGAERVAAELQVCRDLVAKCAGLPLALRIVAERMVRHRDRPFATTLAELADQAQTLDRLVVRDDPDIAVRAVMSWSYRALPPEAARLFRLLGLHPGPDLDDYAVANLAGLPLAQAGDLLELLVRASLLETTRLGRYELHDLLRAYAAECAGTDETEEGRRAALERLLGYYCHMTAAAEAAADPVAGRYRPDLGAPATPGPGFPDEQSAMAWLDVEHPDLLAAVPFAADQGWHRQAWLLAITFDGYLERRGRSADQVATCLAALDASSGDLRAEYELRNILAFAYGRLGRHEDSRTEVGRLVAVTEELGDKRLSARAFNAAALAHAHASRFAESLEAAEKSLAIRLDLEEAAATAPAYAMVAAMSYRLGRIRTSLDQARALSRLSQQAGDRSCEAWAYHLMIEPCLALGRYAEAGRNAELSAGLHAELGDEVFTVEAEGLLSLIAIREGSIDKALSNAWNAFSRGQSTGQWPRAWSALALAYALNGQHHEAREQLHLALRNLHTGPLSEQVESLNDIGEAWGVLGEHSTALENHRRAAQSAEEIEYRFEHVRALLGVGDALRGLGRAGEAEEYWEIALRSADEMGVALAADVRERLESS